MTEITQIFTCVKIHGTVHQEREREREGRKGGREETQFYFMLMKNIKLKSEIRLSGPRPDLVNQNLQ